MSNGKNENSVSSILEHTASGGKNYKTKFYNLDAIIIGNGWDRTVNL